MPAMTRGLGGGRVFQETVEQQLHAEVVDGAAEEDRRGLAREHGGIVPIVPGVFEHLQFFDRLGETSRRRAGRG